jgi:hypothetical protein
MELERDIRGHSTYGKSKVSNIHVVITYFISIIWSCSCIASKQVVCSLKFYIWYLLFICFGCFVINHQKGETVRKMTPNIGHYVDFGVWWKTWPFRLTTSASIQGNFKWTQSGLDLGNVKIGVINTSRQDIGATIEALHICIRHQKYSTD